MSAKINKFYFVKNPDAANEALYQRAVAIAKTQDIVTARAISLGLRCGHNEIAMVMERMEREGIVGPKEKQSRRRVLVKS